MTHPKLIEVLVQQTPKAMVALLIVSSVYFFIFLKFIPLFILIFWFLLQIILAIFRFYNVKMFKKHLKQKNHDQSIVALKKQQTVFVWLNIFQAFMWSVSSFLVVIYAPQPFELVSLVMIIGIITAAALSMSTLYNAYLVFFFAMITPQVIIMLHYGDHQHLGLVALTFIFIPAIILLSKAIYNGQLENIKVNADLEESVKELHKLSMIDTLTSIYNRRYFLQVARDLIALGKREQKEIALIMIDIDFFKKINDTYGHDAGDYMLVRVVSEIETLIRKTDIFARMGGEEFAIILNDTSMKGAQAIAEKIRATIENTTIRYNDIKIELTLSIGISVLNEKNNSIESLYKEADKQLYIAKESGRNSVSPSR